MKTVSLSRVLPSLAILLSLALFGCASSSTSSTAIQQPTPEQLAPVLRSTVAVGVTLSLNKNPRYVADVAALSAAINVAVFASGDVITPERIAEFIGGELAKRGMPPEERAIYIMLAQQIYSNVFAVYHVQTVKISDPRVLLFVGAFKDGLNDAIAAVNAAHAG